MIQEGDEETCLFARQLVSKLAYHAGLADSLEMHPSLVRLARDLLDIPTPPVPSQFPRKFVGSARLIARSPSGSVFAKLISDAAFETALRARPKYIGAHIETAGDAVRYAVTLGFEDSHATLARELVSLLRSFGRDLEIDDVRLQPSLQKLQFTKLGDLPTLWARPYFPASSGIDYFVLSLGFKGYPMLDRIVAAPGFAEFITGKRWIGARTFALASLDVFLIIVASAEQPTDEDAKEDDADDDDAWAPARSSAGPPVLLSLAGNTPATELGQSALSDLDDDDIEFD
jgi:hypothetical protein